MLDNAWFETVEPVFYFRLDGYRPSNTWIGSSRACDPILRGTNALPGDVFHILVGGTFLSKTDGTVENVSFWYPKPLLEKTYGPGNSEIDLFRFLEKRGAVREVKRPSMKVDFAAVRHLPTFPEGHPPFKYESKSTTFSSFVEAARDLAHVVRDNGFDIRFNDFQTDRRVMMGVEHRTDEGIARLLEVHMTEGGEIFVRPCEKLVGGDEFKNTLSDSPLVKPGHLSERSLWASSGEFLRDPAFLDLLTRSLEAAAKPARQSSPRSPRP